MTQRVYCDRDHPGGDVEADQWCEWYHRPQLPRQSETWTVRRSRMVWKDRTWTLVESIVATGVSKSEADHIMTKTPHDHDLHARPDPR